MEAQNDISALQMLPKNGNFTMRWFVLCADPDQDDNAQNIDPANRAVNGNALDLGCIAFGFGKIHGGRATAKTAPSGKVGPFPYQLEGNQYDH
jgi:hypothetical protein